MRKKMLHFLIMFVALFVSAQAYGQKAQSTLDLGAFETPDASSVYKGSLPYGAPVLYEYASSATQTIYTAEQLAAMKGKEITSISFKAYVNGCYTMDYTSSMKIYLHEVDAADFPKNADDVTEWLATNADSNLALNYTADFVSESSEYGYGDFILKFDLTASPYIYTGKNLVITVVNESKAPTGESEVAFYHIDAATTTRTLIFASDNETFADNQAGNNLVADNDEKELTEAPVVRFTYQEGVAPTPTPTYPEKLYAFGDFKGHSWNPNCADYVLNQVTDTAGLYRGELPLVASEGNFAKFNLLTTTGGWNIVGTSSFGPANDGDELVAGTAMQLFGPSDSRNQNVIKIDATKKYEFTVDLRNPEMQTITAKDITPVKPEFPEKLYAYGTFEKEWDPACADYFLPQVADTVGLYRGTLPLVDDSSDEGNYAFFNFLSAVGSWKIAAESAFGPANDASLIEAGVPMQIFDASAPNFVNQNTIKVDLSKTYEFTVDLRNKEMMTVTAKDITPEPEPGVTEPTLTQIAKFTEGLPATGEARQGTYANGAMNIYDKSNGQYTVWNEKGLVNTVTTDAAVANTGITADEAGNIIFTDKVFPGAETPTKLIVYPADGSEMVTIDLTGVPSVGRVDYYSKVRGNILSGEAMMFLPVNGSAAFVVLPFYDGVLDADNVSTIAVANAAVADNGTIIYAINEDENGNIDVIYNKRNGGVSKITIAAGLEGGYNLVDDTYVVSATGRNAANGCDAFKLGKKQYILYPSQTNYRDGFSIAELNNAENNPEVVTFKETYTKNPNGIQANWVFAQVINETTAKIFQYVPGGYVAIYKFQVPAEVTPEPTPTYPAKLYVVGNIPDHSWDGNYDGAALEPVVEAPGTFKGTVTLVQAAADNTNAYFRLTSKPGADWDKYSYAGKSNNQLIALETPTQIWGGEPNGNSNAFMIEGGKAYEMVVDLTDSNNMTLRVTESTSSVNGVDAEAVMVIAGVGEINIIGNAANVAVYNLSGALVSANETTVNCPAGIYLVNVDGKVVKVLVK